MSEEQINTVTLQIATLLVSLLVIFILIIVYRERLQRKADTHVKVKYIDFELGRGFFKLVPINFQDGTICLKGLVKGATDKTYPIGGTYTVAHPESFPRVIQVGIREMVLSTKTWEPLSDEGRDFALKPEFLTLIRNERFGEQAVRRVQEEAIASGTVKKPVKINWTTMLMLIMITLLGIVVWWVINNGDKIMQALGVE